MFARLALLLLLLLMPTSALPAAESALRLAERGVARHAIVVAAGDATPAERFATEELALFLQKITGAAFPIVKASSVSIWLPIGWGAVPPPSNEMEVWVSLKFTGPTYVAGSTRHDQVLMDQIVVVPPEPVRK